MACPGCGCKVTYQYNGLDDDFNQEDEIYERCAGCGLVFDFELEGIDDDDDPPPDDVSVIDPAVGPGGLAVVSQSSRKEV